MTEINRRKSGGDGSQAAAERGYCARLGKLEVKGSVIPEIGASVGDKVEGTVTIRERMNESPYSTSQPSILNRFRPLIKSNL